MQRALVLVAALGCSGGERTRPNRPPPASARDADPGLAPSLPAGVTPLAYDLRLELDPDQEAFHGEVHIRVAISAPTDRISLYADQLEISAASFDDGALTALPAQGALHTFGLGRTIQPRTLTLSFAFTGHTSRDEEGLFRQRAGEHWYLFSQGESVFARRITPCFDEPRWKTPWTVTLVAPKGLVALGNMPVAKQQANGDRVELQLAPTPPMPSYLLAVAVGPFELVDAGTVGKQHVPVRVAAMAGEGKRVGVVAAKLPAIVAAIETYLDDPLPWPKLDLVAVPHLFGAMENPGLVTFDAPVLVGPVDRPEHVRHFTLIAAHEIVHQWFGNLVTPASWDDLWLAEAFASWLGDKVSADLDGFADRELGIALAREQALAADAGPDAAPLHRTLRAGDDPDDTFDAISYDKGEAVLGTFETWIGEEAFRTALRAYLRAHRDGVATMQDLVKAIGDASSPAVGAAFARQVTHTGASVVELALRCTGRPAIEARSRDGSSVPVCVRYPGAKVPAKACALVGEPTEIALPEAAACPAWVDGNAGNAYFHVAWTTKDPRGPARPIEQLPLGERIAVGADLAASVERGDLAIAEALAVVRTLARSRDAAVVHAALVVARAIDPIVGDADRAAWSAWLAARFADRMTSAIMFSPLAALDRALHDDLLELVPAPAKLRSAADGVLRKLTAKRAGPVPPDLIALAAPGDAALFDKLAAAARAAKDPDERDAILEALGRFGADRVDATLGLLTSGDVPAEAAWSSVAGYLARPATRGAAWRAVQANLAAVLARLSPAKAGDVISACASVCDARLRAEVASAFEPHVAEIVNGRKRLDRTLAAIDRCVARRAAAGDLAGALAAARQATAP